MQVKPSKRAKKNKPSQDPIVTEPVINTSAPDGSAHQPPPDPASDIPVPTSDPPIEDILHTSDPETPSPVKRNDLEVEIVKSQFVEPGRPTVLAKCTPRKSLPNAEKPSRTLRIILT